MAKLRTWLWIIFGFLGVCVLGLILVAGAGVYFVSRHIGLEQTTSTNALRAFEATRASFASAQPILEVDALERPREARQLAELPTSPSRPANLYVLAWNPEDRRLARVSVPFWLLRLGRRKVNFLDSTRGFNFERLNLDVPELERIGPALILDYRSSAGERVLIWTQ